MAFIRRFQTQHHLNFATTRILLIFDNCTYIVKTPGLVQHYNDRTIQDRCIYTLDLLYRYAPELRSSKSTTKRTQLSMDFSSADMWEALNSRLHVHLRFPFIFLFQKSEPTIISPLLSSLPCKTSIKELTWSNDSLVIT